MQKNLTKADFARPDREEEEEGRGVAGYLRLFWAGKWIIAATAVLGLLYGIWQAYVVAVPQFRATTQMALEIRPQQVIDIEAVVSGVSGDTASMNTEMVLIRSKELVGRLVDQLNLTEDPEFNPFLDDPLDRPTLGKRIMGLRNVFSDTETDRTPSDEQVRRATIETVRGAISTGTSRDSYIFTISALTRSPAKSALLSNTLAAIYRDDQINQKAEATDNAATWLAARVADLRIELDQRQNDMAQLRSEQALASPEAVAALSAQSVETDTQLRILRQQLESTRAALAALEAAEGTEAIMATADDSQLNAIGSTLATEGAAAQARFDRRYQQIILQLGSSIDRLTQQIADLETQSAGIAAQFDQQSASLTKLQQFARETEATQVLYDTFLSRLKETSLQQGTLQADSRILSDSGPGILATARRSRTMLTYLLLGLALGAGIVVLRDRLRTGFRDAETLERQTRYSVIGQIPKIPAKGRPETIAYLRAKPTSAAAEAIRNLRTSVLLSDVDRPPQVIMSTSTVPGEGKTTMAIALAQNLAGLDKRVLLIEGDVRRRTFTAYFPQAAERGGGILSVISGAQSLAEGIWHAPELGCDVLMGEVSSVNAADVFSSEKFQEFLASARAHYDFIVIDTPPVLVVPDARVIAQSVDAVLYAVKWDKTPAEQVAAGLRQFESVNIGISGLVLSQIDTRRLRSYGYGSGYGTYGAYGKGYYEA